MRAAMKSPPLTLTQILENLGNAGVPKFAKAVALRTQTDTNNPLNSTAARSNVPGTAKP